MDVYPLQIYGLSLNCSGNFRVLLIFGVSVGIGKDNIDNFLVKASPVLLRPEEPPREGDKLDESVDRQGIVHA